MGCSCRRPAALVLLGTLLPGCVSGHLLDAARRRERPVRVTSAALDGDRLVVRYRAEVRDDEGEPLGTTDDAAAIPLATLRTAESPAADRVSPSWCVPPGGIPITIERAGSDGTGPKLRVLEKDGRDTALVWEEAPPASPNAPVPLTALTRIRTAPWVWPLMAPMLAVDAVLTPVLVFFAPAVMVIGE